MYVSDWPKRPNMVLRPNLGGDSISPQGLTNRSEERRVGKECW